MMSRADVGADGKTLYERCKGRRARLPKMEFGDAVLWKKPTGRRTTQNADVQVEGRVFFWA